MSFRHLLVFLSIAVLHAGYVQADQSAFNKGIDSFRKGNYDDAVFHFKKAKASGAKSGNINYNLAVSYFKLEQYDLAKQAFLDAAKNGKYRQLAHYNLGLVADKQSNRNEAITWFTKAANKSDNKKIAELAKGKMTAMGTTDNAAPNERLLAAREDSRQGSKTAPRLKTKAQRKVNGGLTLGIGFDDNISLEAQEGQGSGYEGSYGEVFGYINVPVGDIFTIIGSTYTQDYFSVDGAPAGQDDAVDDFSNVSVGVRARLKASAWTLTPSIEFVDSYLGGSGYQDIWDYKFMASRALGKGNRLSFRYRFSDIESEDNQFDYLEGDRQQYRTSYYTKTPFGRLRLRYQFETNDRQDLTTSNFSPDRHSFRARIKRPLFGRWSMATELEFRTSEYEAIAVGTTRDDDRFRFRLDIDRKMNKKWKMGVLYVYTDNDSNQNTFDYTKNDIQLYSSWRFY